MKVRTIIPLVSLILVLLVSSGMAQYPALVPLPANLQGELNGVPYTIRVPANWNGTLLVYSYGYGGESNPLPLAPLPAVESALLAKGFALTAARASGSVAIPPFPDAGWNMKERIQNTAALTAAFRDMVGHPKRTIVWGKSMGGNLALALIEKFPGLYDGAVPLCAGGAGTPRMFDLKLDIVVAYSVAFPPWKEQWGTPGNLRPDLNVYTEVYPHVLQQLTPDKYWRWEFFRLVSHVPYDPSFYGPPTSPTGMNFRFQTVWLAFAPLPDINRRAGGRVAQNIGRIYTLSEKEIAYLKGLGGDPETLLKEMNDKAIYASDRNARNYVEHYYNPTGRITRPVLTLHTTGDAAAIPNNESAYANTVDEHYLLMQVFSIGNGQANTHCTFTPAQYLAGIDGMMHWLDTGNEPDPAVYFPESLGFDSDFVPDPWPW